MEPLNEYEQKQADAIEAWRKEKPSVVNRALGWATKPLVWLVQTVVPEAAIRAALRGANWFADNLADSADIKRDGKVDTIDHLRTKDLELSDHLANNVHNWAIALATGEGGVTGFFGLPGLAADIPTIITLSLRTVHKIALCYGYICKDPHDRDFVCGVLSASGANTLADKVRALLVLRSIEVVLAKQTWKAMAEKAASQQMGTEAAIISLRQLAKQLGINLTKRKAMQMIPVVGTVIGGGVNALYISDVGWAARRAFQERWLIDNRKLDPTAEDEKPHDSP